MGEGLLLPATGRAASPGSPACPPPGVQAPSSTPPHLLDQACPHVNVGEIASRYRGRGPSTPSPNCLLKRLPQVIPGLGLGLGARHPCPFSCAGSAGLPSSSPWAPGRSGFVSAFGGRGSGQGSGPCPGFLDLDTCVAGPRFLLACGGLIRSGHL